MKRAIYAALFLGFCCVLFVGKTFAYWEWTPETGKWINPKLYVGETSAEQWMIARDAYETSAYEEALTEFQKLLKHFPSSEEAPEAQFMVGDCQEKLGLPYEACRSYQEAIDKFPSTNRFREIVERQVKIADFFYDEKSSEMSITEKAKGIFSVSNWEKAANIYQMAIKNYPYHEKADYIQFKIASCYMNLGKYEIACAEFEKIYYKYPHSEWLEEAEYLKSVCQINESSKFPNNEEIFGKAIKSVEEFIDKYPESEFVEAAKKELRKLNNRKGERIYEIAKFYEKNKEQKAAKIYYLQIIEQFPDSIWAEHAKSRLKNLE